MKKNLIIQFSLLFLLASLLAGCAGAPMASAFAPTAPAAAVDAAEAAQPTLLPTLKPRPTATAAPDEAQLAAQAAEDAARAYFAALEAGDTEAAAQQISTFSLMVFEMTRGDAAAELQRQKSDGAGWSKLETGEVRLFDEQTMLVDVRYELKTEEGAEPREEVWAVRNESGTWRVNRSNLIDFRTLTAEPQTTNGVTVLPVQMLRFTDRLRLELLVQNRTSQPVVFGQVNEELATFHIGEEAVIAEKTQVVFNPLRSAHGVPLEIKGLYEAYPDSVTIRQWKNYDVKPWYEFDLTR